MLMANSRRSDVKTHAVWKDVNDIRTAVSTILIDESLTRSVDVPETLTFGLACLPREKQESAARHVARQRHNTKVARCQPRNLADQRGSLEQIGAQLLRQRRTPWHRDVNSRRASPFLVTFLRRIQLLS